MINNADMTLYNKTPGGDAYYRTYLYGVNWQDGKKVSVGEHGLVSADMTSVFIIFRDGYLKPAAFRQMQDKAGRFTLENGDIIVRGIVDFELTGEKGHDEKTLRHQFDDVMTIVSIDTRDNGSASMRHWEVTAK